VANVVFSVCAGIASLAIAVLAGVQGHYVVTGVWAALAVGFAARAGYGCRRLRQGQRPPDGARR
jgi:hypothetical protein